MIFYDLCLNSHDRVGDSDQLKYLQYSQSSIIQLFKTYLVIIHFLVKRIQYRKVLSVIEFVGFNFNSRYCRFKNATQPAHCVTPAFSGIFVKKCQSQNRVHFKYNKIDTLAADMMPNWIDEIKPKQVANNFNRCFCYFIKLAVWSIFRQRHE